MKVLGMGGGYSPTLTNGAAHVNLNDSAGNEIDLSLLGEVIHMVQDSDRFTITTSTTPVVTPDISWSDEVSITVSRTGTTDTIKVEVSYDGTNYEEFSPAGRDSADGTYESCAALADKMVTIPFNSRSLRFTASGTTDTFGIAWSARNSGRGAV